MKLNTVKLGVLALGLFGFSLAMSAQEKKGPNFEKMMKRFDSDEMVQFLLRNSLLQKEKMKFLLKNQRNNTQNQMPIMMAH